jgi:3-hydroxyacyl-[acyl-carrier-protein] dehydratase
VGVTQIKRLLPHRYPMLLVDRVIDATGGVELRATKAITVNEPCYRGLADDADHAYPAVLVLESWCQAAGLLLCLRQPDPGAFVGQLMLLGGVFGVEFDCPAQPGEVLDHTVRVARAVADTAVVEGETTVNDRLVLRIGSATIALRPPEAIAG